MLTETERLVLTELTKDMVSDVWKNSLEDDVERFVPDEYFETYQDAEEAVDFLSGCYDDPDSPQLYAIFTKKDNKNIGYVQFVPMGDDIWEIGYHVAQKYTGHGYATEAVLAFLPIMMGKFLPKKLLGIAIKENVASIQVLKKCGFKTVFEGIDEYQGEDMEIVRMEYIK